MQMSVNNCQTLGQPAPTVENDKNKGWLDRSVSCVKSVASYIASIPNEIYKQLKSFVEYCIDRVATLYNYLTKPVRNNNVDNKAPQPNNGFTTLPKTGTNPVAKGKVIDKENPFPVTTNPVASVEKERNNGIKHCDLRLMNLYSVAPMYMDYSKMTPQEQASQILDWALELIAKYPDLPGVAVTYSANHEQTKHILNCYDKGEWKTNTSGANQAEVVQLMEQLMENEDQYKSLQQKFRILPVSTMTYDKNKRKVACTKEEFDTCMQNLSNLRHDGWGILGWKNQDSIKNKEQPFAIGGGVAGSITPKLHINAIQSHLTKFTVENFERSKGVKFKEPI